MRAKLVVVGGDAKTPEIELRLPSVLGRGREASLTLSHPLVSREHCEIFEDNGRLMVRDLGSLNGTFVANERITEAVLEHGQLLTVGTVTFRAVYMNDDGQEATQTDIPTAAPMASDETVPAPNPADFQSGPPMAMPLPAEEVELPQPSEAAEEDDDLSSFFDSLQ